MGSVEPIKSIFQFTLISLHTDFEFPSNQCEEGTPCKAEEIKITKPSNFKYKIFISAHENWKGSLRKLMWLRKKKGTRKKR